MHAAFILPNLGVGGTERVTLDLMGGFLERGARVDLVLMERGGELLPLVPKEVRVIDLGAPRLRQAICPLRAYFRDEQPTSALAAMWPLTTVAILAASGLPHRPRLVVSDHAPLLVQYGESRFSTAALRLSVRATYRFADAIVGASDGLAAELAHLAGLSRERVTTIHNPIPVPELGLRGLPCWPELPGKRIMSAGRLKSVKNFPILVEAFAPLGRAQEAVLAIIGEGSDREAIAAKVRDLGVADRVLLPGFTATPGDWYRDADLFVLASDYEGFGNVLIEAMHFGTSVVSTDCPCGPAEALGQGKWGTLVPCRDVEALTKAMRESLLRPADPEAQKLRAAGFSIERSVDAYWHAMNG